LSPQHQQQLQQQQPPPGGSRAVGREEKKETKPYWDEILGVCLINGKRVNVTVDTGAVVTFVHQRIVQEDLDLGKLIFEPCFERFVSANGVPVHIAGMVEVELQIGSSRLCHKIYISDNIVDDCLLGMDVLSICPSSKKFVEGLRKMFDNGVQNSGGEVDSSEFVRESTIDFADLSEAKSVCDGGVLKARDEGYVVSDSAHVLSTCSSGESEGKVTLVESKNQVAGVGVVIRAFLALVHLCNWSIEQICELIKLEF
jgi:hypothetical protein